MNHYYLPDNYPDTAKGARLYIKDLRSSDKEKEEIRLTIKAVKLIINYNKNSNDQPIIDANNGNDGAMLFSVWFWESFISHITDKIKVEFNKRKERINSPTKAIPIARNKGDKYKIKYYLPEAYEQNLGGMRLYYSDMIRNAYTDKDTKERLLRETKVISLVQDYHIHKDKQPLQEAMTNEPELFNSEMFRAFVADVMDSTYKPTKEYMRKETQEKHQRVVANIEYFINMGFPKLYESTKPNKFNACQLTAYRLGISKHSAQEIHDNRDKLNGSTARAWRTEFNDWDDWLYTWDGQSIWVLNGFRVPESEKEIEQLEKLLKTLPEKEHKKIKDFSRGYNARKTKLPTTNKELKRIKTLLSKREHYELVKSLQIREISLKT